MRGSGHRVTGSGPSVVVAAALSARPTAGGHAWFVRTWLQGLARLGCRVLLVDRLLPGTPLAAAEALVREVCGSAGVDGALLLGDRHCSGPAYAELAGRVAAADVVLDVMGFLGDGAPDLLASARLPVFLDVDPGVGQQWAALGLHDPYDRYGRFVTVGSRIGTPGCSVPTGGRQWLTTLPPVLLDEWPRQRMPGRAVTTVGMWRGPYAPLQVGGRRHGQRAHEFRRYAGLPARSPFPLQVAIAFEAWDAADRASLDLAGWQLRDPREVAGSLESYRRYVQASAAELCVARESYVVSRCGWFSDRSAAYLASGRPVVASDTGFGGTLPTGAGLLAVDGPDEAAAALEAVAAEPARHGGAARELAGEYLDSDRVLSVLLDRLGSTTARAAA